MPAPRVRKSAARSAAGGGDLAAPRQQAARSPSFNSAEWLPTLFEVAPRAAALGACEQLERKWHEFNNNALMDYGYSPPDASALAVVAAGSKCPWAMPLLDRFACNWELRSRLRGLGGDAAV